MTDPAVSRTEFLVLGPLTVVHQRRPLPLGGARQMAVLARLLIDVGAVVSMDDLVDGVWDGDEPSRPDATVRSYLSHLRSAVEPGRDRSQASIIERCAPGYRLAVDPEQVDVHCFTTDLDHGRRALADGEHALAVRRLGAALARWRGAPYGGVPDTVPVVAARARLEELRLGAVESLAEARLACGDQDGVTGLLQPELRAYPLREHLTELAMLAFYRAGRQSEALAVCGRLRTELLDRLGVDPSPAVQELERRILSHDDGLWSSQPTASTPTSVPAPAPTPSPDHRRSVSAGRRRADQVADEVVQALQHDTSVVVAITGEPGSGKSTVVNELATTVRARLTAVDAPGGEEPTVVVARSRRTAGRRPLWLWSHVLDRLGLDDHDAGTNPPPEVDLGLSEVAAGLRTALTRGPAIIVIEDGQWADASSIDAVHHVIEELADRPLAVVVTWRHTDRAEPEVLQALRRLARLPALVRVELDPLDRSTVARLTAAAALPSSGDGVDVHAIAGGNAAYVTELLYGLADDAESADPTEDPGVDAAGTGPRTSEPVDRFLPRWPLTTNLRELIRARVDDVHPEASEVLTLAAMVGGPFAAGLLAAAGDLPARLVEDVLERSAVAGLLAGDAASNGFEFVHPVAAAVLRDDLSPPRRARLHDRLGHALWRRSAPPLAIARQLARARSANASVLAVRFALEAAGESGIPGPRAEHEQPDGLVRELVDIVAAALPAFAFVPGSGEYESLARRFLEQTLPTDDLDAGANPSARGGNGVADGHTRRPTGPQSFLNRAEAG